LFDGKGKGMLRGLSVRGRKPSGSGESLTRGKSVKKLEGISNGKIVEAETNGNKAEVGGTGNGKLAEVTVGGNSNGGAIERGKSVHKNGKKAESEGQGTKSGLLRGKSVRNGNGVKTDEVKTKRRKSWAFW